MRPRLVTLPLLLGSLFTVAAARAESGVFEVGPSYPSLSLSVQEVTVVEGTGGAAPTATASLRLSEPWKDTVIVDVVAVPDTATTADFMFTPTRVTFLAGETVKQVSAAIVPDSLPEEDETFTLRLQSPVNAYFGNSLATVTIADDDRGPPSQLDAEGTSVQEGDSGITKAEVRVRLTPANVLPVSVGWSLSPDGIRSTASGRLTFAPGETLKTIPVETLGDTDWEPDQHLTVSLNTPSVAGRIGTGKAEVVILNDDAATSISVADVTVTEGNEGARAANLVVRLSRPAQADFKVLWGPVRGTATPETDYRNELKDSIHFAPGETSRVVPLSVIGDRIRECDEGVVLAFMAAYGGDDTRHEVKLLIRDDDGAPAGETCGDPFAAAVSQDPPAIDPPGPVKATPDAGPQVAPPTHDAAVPLVDAGADLGGGTQVDLAKRDDGASCAMARGDGARPGLLLVALAGLGAIVVAGRRRGRRARERQSS